MKVTFEFDTESENFSQTELEAHYQAWRMAHCLSLIEDQLRQWYKYDNRPAIPTEEVRDTILEIIAENVNMERMGY